MGFPGGTCFDVTRSVGGIKFNTATFSAVVALPGQPQLVHLPPLAVASGVFLEHK